VGLYELKADLSESRNLAGEMPERTKELRALLGNQFSAVGAQMPRSNPDYVLEATGARSDAG
jgi:hypothetical protein